MIGFTFTFQTAAAQVCTAIYNGASCPTQRNNKGCPPKEAALCCYHPRSSSLALRSVGLATLRDTVRCGHLLDELMMIAVQLDSVLS